MAGPASVVPYNDPLEYLNYIHDDPVPSPANFPSLIQQPNNPTTHHPTDFTAMENCPGPMDEPMVLNILHQLVNGDGFVGDVGAGGSFVGDVGAGGGFVGDGGAGGGFVGDVSAGGGFVGDVSAGGGFAGDVGAGPSNYNINNQEQQPSSGEASNGTRGGSGGHGNYDYLGAGWMPVEFWPPDPVAFGCTCCLVLRELLHFDGTCTTKLEIHGRLGIICHAILEIRNHSKPYPEHYMFDFCKKSIENVGQFLREYHNDRLKAGFALVQDPLSVFYQALCVGLEWDTRFMYNEGFYGSSSLANAGLAGEQQNFNMGEEQADEGKEVRIRHTEGENSKETETKSALAKQRERAGRLTLKDFGEYFHLPIEEAAKRMKLCPTVVKKICRRDGMPRWPHRKLKSIQRQISNLKESLSSSSGQQRAYAETEIRRLEKEIADLCGAANR